MGWEKRKGKLYYYRKERQPDGRVRSIYYGRGARGKAAAREDAERRAAALIPQEIETASPVLESPEVEKPSPPPMPERHLAPPILPRPPMQPYLAVAKLRPAGRFTSAVRKWRELGLRRR